MITSAVDTVLKFVSNIHQEYPSTFETESSNWIDHINIWKSV